MIEASQETALAAMQEFQNSDLGEPFLPPDAGLTPDALDRCRRDYVLEDYAGQPCVMGVDVGIKLHVVVRQAVNVKPGIDNQLPRPLWFVGEVASFDDLDNIISRYNVMRCVIDAFPETHMARSFYKKHPTAVWLATYRQQAGHERTGGGSEPNWYHLNRIEAMDATFQALRNQVALLPKNARLLGGRIREGIGDYYRQVLAPRRLLQRNAQGNWEARYEEGTKADHFAHAEVYTHMADWPMRQRPRPQVYSAPVKYTYRSFWS
jgi:hypothetical protein